MPLPIPRSVELVRTSSGELEAPAGRKRLAVDSAAPQCCRSGCVSRAGSRPDRSSGSRALASRFRRGSHPGYHQCTRFRQARGAIGLAFGDYHVPVRLHARGTIFVNCTCFGVPQCGDKPGSRRSQSMARSNPRWRDPRPWLAASGTERIAKSTPRPAAISGRNWRRTNRPASRRR